jgi:hypothetical protein
VLFLFVSFVHLSSFPEGSTVGAAGDSLAAAEGTA